MLVQGSGIAEDVIAERGNRTCTGYSELQSLGIALPRHADATGLLFPLWSVDGTPATHILPKEQRSVPYTVYRPDIPLIDAKGREHKYLNPKNTPTRLDCHPRCHDLLRTASQLLWVTEGQKKGDKLVTEGACAIALLGVENWRSPDWVDVPLRGRSIGVCYDSDVMTKAPVQRALTSLTAYLTHKGAEVLHVYLPSTTDDKTGVDDFLLTHSLADLEALLEPPRDGTAAPTSTRSGWQAQLLTTHSGMPLESFGNLKLCVAHGADAQTLWYNLVSDRPMVGELPLTDAQVEQAALQIEQHVHLPIRKLDLVRKALVAQCREQARDVLQDWLVSLPPWDQEPRLTEWLCDHAGVPKTAYTMAVARLLPVSMVARALHPGIQCRSVVIFEGAQDIGKSRLVKTLAGETWYREVSGTLEGKEAHMLMKGIWLVELSEMDVMLRTEESRVKSFITMCNDEYVPKYANDPIKLARRTILVGTINPEGDGSYLRDQTGATRYYPVPVQAIDLDAVAACRDQLFAEALAWFTHHPTDWWRMPAEAAPELQETREARRKEGAFEGPRLREWLEHVRTGASSVTAPFHTEDALRSCFQIPPERWTASTKDQVGKAIRKLGWTNKPQRVDGRLQRLWLYEGVTREQKM
jgi:hypothetical protein